MNVRAHMFVSGKVQGVFFRQHTRRQAVIHNVKGWIKNLSDGRVEAVFEGDESAVKAMLEFCRVGPKGASVTAFSMDWEPLRYEFGSFNIVH
jgi:acylphosphatase